MGDFEERRVRVTAVRVEDLRFPTSRSLDGSDAVNTDPDYSAAYVVVHTSAREEGYGLVFTLGRGNDVAAAAIETLGSLLVGEEVEGLLADMGGLWRRLVYDSQLRWLGPEN